MDGAGFQPAWWHWAILGVAFITVEVFVPGGFLIGMGIAALVVSLVAALAAKLGWEHQLLLFAALSLVSVFVMRRYFVSSPIETDRPLLNQRGHQYVGRRFTLDEPIVNEQGRIRVDDSTWKIRGEDCDAGTAVIITGVDGVVLHAERADAAAGRAPT